MLRDFVLSMIDFFQKFKTKAVNVAGMSLGLVRPNHKGRVGWLATASFHIGNQAVRIKYRPESRGDRGVLKQIFEQEDYNIAQWGHGRALKRYYDALISKRRLLIIDAGSNIGAASVYFDCVYPGCLIVGIEPEVCNYFVAQQNCCSNNFSIIRAALWGENTTLFLKDLGRSDWGFQVGRNGVHPVPALTVSHILETEGIGSLPFIIKIDVEGSEMSVFSGPCDWLEAFALVIIELHDWMDPGKGLSNNFFKQVSKCDFDILNRGENTFCFNNKLLKDFY